MIPVWAILALASAIVIGTRDIVVKEIMKKDHISARESIAFEYILMFSVILILFFNKIDFAGALANWPYVLFKGVALFLTAILYYKLLSEHQISHVTPMLNLSPLFLLIFASLFLSEHLTILQIAGILTTVGATFVLEKAHHGTLTFHKKDRIFYLQVLAMLITVSATAIADKLVLNRVNIYTNMVFTSLLILVFLAFHFDFRTATRHLKKYPHALFMHVLSIGSTALVLLALQHPAAIVSIVIPLRRLGTLFSSVFGGVLFHEKHLWHKAGAVCLMLVGVFLMLT